MRSENNSIGHWYSINGLQSCRMVIVAWINLIDNKRLCADDGSTLDIHRSDHNCLSQQIIPIAHINDNDNKASMSV